VTRALIKRHVLEPGPDNVSALLEQVRTVVASAFIRVEMVSALAEAVRMNWVDSEEARSAWQNCLHHRFVVVRLVLSQSLIDRAWLPSCSGRTLPKRPSPWVTHARDPWQAGNNAALLVRPENPAA
jgi:hypothetical protein